MINKKFNKKVILVAYCRRIPESKIWKLLKKIFCNHLHLSELVIEELH